MESVAAVVVSLPNDNYFFLWVTYYPLSLSALFFLIPNTSNTWSKAFTINRKSGVVVEDSTQGETLQINKKII